MHQPHAHRSPRRVVRALVSSLAASVILATSPVLAQDGTDAEAAAEDTASLPMGRLVWTSDRARDGGLNVWLLEAVAGEPRRLTSGDVNDFTAQISPDGTSLVFASDRDNPGALTASGSYLRAYDIYRAPLDGGDPERVYGDRTFKMGPTWSPDGALIAYGGEDPDGEQQSETGGLTPQVWVVASDGSGSPRMLTDEAGGADDPTWSPDGSRIAYASVQGGRIMVMAADGSDPVPLSNGPGDAEPAWSPDGTQIVFSSDRSGDRELYVIAADGGEATRLTDSPDFDGQPTWSPDGAMIAFTTDRGPSRDVYLMNADGSDPVNLSGNGPGEDGEHRGSDFSPSWSE